MVCAKFAHTTFDSNSLYLEQLPRQFELFLRREFRVVLLERLGVAHGDKVRFRIAVAAGDSVEEPFMQFLAEEVGRVAFPAQSRARSCSSAARNARCIRDGTRSRRLRG